MWVQLLAICIYVCKCLSHLGMSLVMLRLPKCAFSDVQLLSCRKFDFRGRKSCFQGGIFVHSRFFLN